MLRDAIGTAMRAASRATSRIARMPGGVSRFATPSGLITTRRSPTTADTPTSSGTASSTPATGSRPGHRSDRNHGPPASSIRATSGIDATYSTRPSTAAPAATITASATVISTTWPGVAPTRRSAASRWSRRATVSRAAAPPNTSSGTTMSTLAITVRIR